MNFSISPSAVSDTAEAWDVIVQSIGSFNFNQTGIYMLLDFWLLKLFGASAFALRLPSLLSAGWLLISAATFCSARRLGNAWKVVLILALLAQPWVMNFAAEARPYMPLAAATVGSFAFYSMPLERRRGAVQWFGAISICLGSLMHPYFPAYLAAVICIGFIRAVLEDNVHFTRVDFIRFLDARKVVAGLAIFLMAGGLTWMRGSIALHLDPFQWIHREDLLVTSLGAVHLGFVCPCGISLWTWYSPPYLILYAMAAVLLLYPLSHGAWQARLRGLLAPSLLAFGTLLLSSGLAWLSYRSHYSDSGPAMGGFCCPDAGCSGVVHCRICPGMRLLVSVEFARPGDSLPRSTSLPSVHHRRALKLSQIQGDMANLPAAVEPLPPEHPDNDQWVRLANANIAEGGPVWAMFRKFYDR